MDRTVWPASPRLLAGRYRVDGSLGRGGMSEVFHGYDERLDRRVAIKILQPPSPGSVPAVPDSPEAAEILDALDRDRKRFLCEIRTTAQLEHPGTPAVYDTGVETAPDGSPQLWLVMQLLRGSTLEALLDHADYVSTPPGASPGGDESRDPTRPFRRPLLAPARSRRSASNRGRLTDAEAERLKANVRTLLDNDRPSEAISLLETASTGPARTRSWNCGCAISWVPHCSSPGSTRLRRGVHARRFTVRCCRRRLPPVPAADRLVRPRLRLPCGPRLRRDRQAGQGPGAASLLRTERRRRGGRGRGGQGPRLPFRHHPDARRRRVPR